MSKLIKIKLDNKVLISKKFQLSDKLNEIRELLKEKITNPFFFYLKEVN